MPKRRKNKYPKNADALLKKVQAGEIKLTPQTRLDPPSVPVSVTLITKNCAESLKLCLASVHQHFLRTQDEIVVLDTGSTDDTVKVARSFGAHVIERPDLRKDMGALVKQWLPDFYAKFGGETQFSGGCLLDFAGARQIVTDAAKNDTIFWLDADDILEEAKSGALREMVDRHMGKDIDAIFLSYLYSFDKHDGRPTTVLKRERIVDRRKYYWKGKCHETLIPREGTVSRGVGWFEDLATAVVHRHCRDDHQLSDIRNYCIIRNEIEADLAAGNQPDVRSIFYMGNACRGLKMFAEGITMYNRAIELSGSRDDRFSAAYYICISYLAPEIQRPLEALDYAYQCVRLKPEDPRGYYAIARCYHIMGKHADSLRFFDFGRALPEPTDTLHSYDPEHIHTLPYFLAIQAAKELEDEEKVKELGGALHARRGEHPDVKNAVGDITNWLAGRLLCRSVKSMCVNMRPADPKEQLRSARAVVGLLPEIPEDLEKIGLGKLEPAETRTTVRCQYTNEAGEQITETKAATLADDVVIWCGHTLEPWGPKSDGIGGSEKAVIQMAPRLQARGLNVSVYCNVPPDQRGVAADGVLWRHWSEYDFERPRGTVIFWRNVAALESPWPIQKRIFWGHDVQRPENWTDARIAAADQIWFLSQYHASTLGPELRAKMEKKIWYTRNGIDAALFKGLDCTDRRTNRIVYCSSPDRGMLTAIKVFQAAFKGDPTAELHIAYGFNKNYRDMAAKQEYGHIPDVNRDMCFYDYMKLVMAETDKDPRIKYHGRMRGSDLAALMGKSKVWLYPTRFPEISCMSAMEAQAAGCQIVASPYAALMETILWASTGVYPVDPENIEQSANRLRNAAFADGDPNLAEWARTKYDYERLADEWLIQIRK